MKKTALLLIAACMTLTTAGLLQADDIGVVRGKLQAKYGKFDKLVKDLTMVMEMTMVDGRKSNTVEATMSYKEPRFRMDSKIDLGEKGGAMTTTVIYDGTDMWMIAPMMGTRKLAAKDQAKYNKDRSWKWWNVLTDGGTVTGSETVGGRDCYVIEFTQPGEQDKDAARPPFSKLWLDKDALVQVKAEMIYEKGKKGVALYSDFRPAIGKLEMPYKTEMSVDGKLVSTAVIKSIVYNTKISDDLFSVEKAKGQNKGMGDLFKGFGGK
jgi:outer membrane lipoprotein-sorting protein